MAKMDPKKIVVLCKNPECEGWSSTNSRTRMNFINSYFGNFAAYQCPACETQRFLSFMGKKHEDVTEASIPWIQWGIGMIICSIMLFGVSIGIKSVELVTLWHILGWTGFLVGVFGAGIAHEKKSEEPMPFTAIVGLWLIGIGVLFLANVPTMYAELIASQEETLVQIPDWWKWMNREERAETAGISQLVLGAMLFITGGLTNTKKVPTKK